MTKKQGVEKKVEVVEIKNIYINAYSMLQDVHTIETAPEKETEENL